MSDKLYLDVLGKLHVLRAYINQFKNWRDDPNYDVDDIGKAKDLSLEIHQIIVKHNDSLRLFEEQIAESKPLNNRIKEDLERSRKLLGISLLREEELEAGIRSFKESGTTGAKFELFNLLEPKGE